MVTGDGAGARLAEGRASVQGGLTGDDLRMLVKGPTADDRAQAAHKLCRRMDRDDLSEAERLQAHEILRVMAGDAAELVRRALAVTLKSSALLPHDVAMKLARDVESIAVPLLNFSPVFTDDDLAEVIRLGEPVRQTAIARRPRVSAKVTTTLVEHGCEAAVQAACANDNAVFSEGGLQTVLHRFTRSEAVLAAVAYRKALPLSVTEKLIDMVSEGVREHLVRTHALPPQVALDLSIATGERAAIDLIDQVGRTDDIKGFVVHMKGRDKLTPSLLLRALAHGHMSFFEWSIAELSGVPHHRAWMMIHDAGPLGLRAIYERAGLPSRLFGAFRCGVDTFHAMNFEEGPQDRARFQAHMLQRFLTQSVGAPQEDVDYLLEKMDRMPAEAGRRAPSQASRSANA